MHPKAGVRAGHSWQEKGNNTWFLESENHILEALIRKQLPRPLTLHPASPFDCPLSPLPPHRASPPPPSPPADVSPADPAPSALPRPLAPPPFSIVPPLALPPALPPFDSREGDVLAAFAFLL